MSAEIVVADCIPAMQSMYGHSVDAVITDPPYNVGVNYGNGSKADRRADYPEWCEQWIAEAFRLTRPGGALWIVSGQEYGAEIDIAIRRVGWTIRNRVVWHETFGVYCHRKFGRCARPVFYAVKPGGAFTFNADKILVPSARFAVYGDRRGDPRGKIPGDVWQFSRVAGTFRERVKGVPTQLPMALVQRMVVATTDLGDTVLDPFAGSGTVPIVAHQLGRHAIGIERNPQYAQIATSRIQSADQTGNGRPQCGGDRQHG